MSRANGAVPEHGADPLPEPHCKATTRAGQPCRNRPLEGQSYCRIHAPLDGADSAAPSQAVALIGSSDEQELPIGGAEAEPAGDAALEDAGRAEAAAAVQELEVEIRNHDEEAARRDLAAE